MEYKPGLLSGSAKVGEFEKCMFWSLPAALGILPLAVRRIQRKRRISFSFNLSPILPKSKSVVSLDSSSSDDEEDGDYSKYTADAPQ